LDRFGFDAHLLCDGQQQVAEMGFGIDRAMIGAHILSITLELFNLMVVINVFSVLEPRLAPPASTSGKLVVPWLFP
jgi:hypothetical protein